MLRVTHLNLCNSIHAVVTEKRDKKLNTPTINAIIVVVVNVVVVVVVVVRLLLLLFVVVAICMLAIASKSSECIRYTWIFFIATRFLLFTFLYFYLNKHTQCTRVGVGVCVGVLCGISYVYVSLTLTVTWCCILHCALFPPSFKCMSASHFYLNLFFISFIFFQMHSSLLEYYDADKLRKNKNNIKAKENPVTGFSVLLWH